MSTALAHIAEERIARAAAAGLFDHLPGAVRLDLDDQLLVPAEMRMANRILRNAGCLPPQLEAQKEARHAAANAAVAQERAAMRAALGRLTALRNAVESKGSLGQPMWARYAPQLLQRFTRRT